MLPRRARRPAAGPEVPPGTETRYAVVISADGAAYLDGRRIPQDDGESLRDAALNALQSRARARGEPVEATVTDRRQRYTVCLRVSPDGSSRAVEPEPEPQPVSESEPVPEAVSAAPAPTAPTVPQVPPELADMAAGINQEVAARRLEHAMALACRAQGATVRRHGADHPYSLELQAVVAYIAYLAGDYRQSVGISLRLAQLRYQQGDPRAREDLTRATAAWRSIADTRTAIAHGENLTGLWRRIAAGGEPDPADAQLLRRIERRVSQLARQEQRLAS